MIEVLIDHSYEEDYFQIDTVTVKIDDLVEADRVRKIIREINLEGSLVEPSNALRSEIAKVLGVDVEIIDIDTNEIDI